MRHDWIFETGLLRPGLLLMGLLLLGACRAAEDASTSPAEVPATVAIGDIEWYVDYDAAVEVARRRDVPLWVHFGENPG